jgi:ethanolamine ammonia-lyase small subunit
MSDDSLPANIEKIQRRTPARLLRGRSGGAYRTSTQLELRAAHAAARDAVRTEFELAKHIGADSIERFGIFEVSSEAQTKDQYLLRPDLGRKLSANARDDILQKCPAEPDLQIVIGDGLSTTAVAMQAPSLLLLLVHGAVARGWKLGQIFAIRFCRVGILNQIGDLLRPKVAVLLIGERPGLATAESLSAYMAFQPGSGHTDAQRNLISNIHRRGVTSSEAAGRILNLAARMMSARASGVQIREALPETSGQLGE